jgi:hypothetical protein
VSQRWNKTETKMTPPILIPDIDDESTHSFRETHLQESQGWSFPAYSLERDRERDGRCGACGMQTHRLRMDPCHGITLKVPLTIESEVYRGRCLFCFPLPARETACKTHSIHQEFSPSARSPVAFSRASLISSSMETESLSSGQDTCEGFDSTEIVDTLYTMGWNARSERVQERGCEQLWILSWDDETSIVIGRLGGIHRILDAMSQFPQNSHLQRCACEALQNLALNSYNRSTIVDYGGAALIVQAMMRHFDSLDIQQCGCVALASVATYRELQDDIIRAGGGHAIIHAFHKYNGNENIRRWALQALLTLGVDPRGYAPKQIPTSEEYFVHVFR